MSNVFLITGCCGFLGSNMCEFLLKKKYEVIGIDNLLTGSLNNIKYFRGYKTFSFIKHNVIYPIKIDKKIDFILHFASTASPVDYIKYPIKTLRIGSIGTENILKLGLINNAKVLVASTSEVYGDPLEHPQKETYYGNVNSVGPRGVYDEAKRYYHAGKPQPPLSTPPSGPLSPRTAHVNVHKRITRAAAAAPKVRRHVPRAKHASWREMQHERRQKQKNVQHLYESLDKKKGNRGKGFSRQRKKNGLRKVKKEGWKLPNV